MKNILEFSIIKFKEIPERKIDNVGVVPCMSHSLIVENGVANVKALNSKCPAFKLKPIHYILIQSSSLCAPYITYQNC